MSRTDGSLSPCQLPRGPGACLRQQAGGFPSGVHEVGIKSFHSMGQGQQQSGPSNIQWSPNASAGAQYQSRLPSASLLATANLGSMYHQANHPPASGLGTLPGVGQQWAMNNNATTAAIATGNVAQLHVMPQPVAPVRPLLQHLSPALSSAQQHEEQEQQRPDLAALLQLLSALQMPDAQGLNSPCFQDTVLSGTASSADESDDLLSASHGSDTPTMPGMGGAMADFSNAQSAMLHVRLQHHLAQQQQQLQIEQQAQRMQHALQQEQLLLAHQLRMQQAAAAAAPAARLPASLLSLLAGTDDDGTDGHGLNMRSRKRGGVATHCTHKLFKTEMCRHWMNEGGCAYGHRCQFAHGDHELRLRPNKAKAMAAAAQAQAAAASRDSSSHSVTICM